jgi:Icc-related predicted phosphoesterase
VGEYLVPEFSRTRERLGDLCPSVFLILGNDDPRSEESFIEQAAQQDIWQHIHNRKAVQEQFDIYGYAMVPPTPFLLKDWERYDVSRYVPPGCVSPEEGRRSLPCSESELKWGTIQKDLVNLAGEDSLDRAIFLFHTPPYETPLDRAALDGRMSAVSRCGVSSRNASRCSLSTDTCMSRPV